MSQTSGALDEHNLSDNHAEAKPPELPLARTHYQIRSEERFATR